MRTGQCLDLKLNLQNRKKGMKRNLATTRSQTWFLPGQEVQFEMRFPIMANTLNTKKQANGLKYVELKILSSDLLMSAKTDGNRARVT